MFIKFFLFFFLFLYFFILGKFSIPRHAYPRVFICRFFLFFLLTAVLIINISFFHPSSTRENAARFNLFDYPRAYVYYPYPKWGELSHCRSIRSYSNMSTASITHIGILIPLAFSFRIVSSSFNFFNPNSVRSILQSKIILLSAVYIWFWGQGDSECCYGGWHGKPQVWTPATIPVKWRIVSHIYFTLAKPRIALKWNSLHLPSGILCVWRCVQNGSDDAICAEYK